VATSTSTPAATERIWPPYFTPPTMMATVSGVPAP
jgi:hypothetical protein